MPEVWRICVREAVGDDGIDEDEAPATTGKGEIHFHQW